MNILYGVLFYASILDMKLKWMLDNKLISPFPRFLGGLGIGKVTSHYVNEASGLCASRVHKNVLYTHNDSGDTQRIFAIDGTSGATLATINIAGAQSQDWEDIACGPCAGGSGHCIYIADTGGNAGGLSNTIYRIREPDVIKSQTVPAESALMFSWDQENCETLMVDPRGQVYVISKVQGGLGKFVQLPSTAWGRSDRTHVHDGVYLTVRTKNENPTGGDISPDGREMLVKTYGSVFYWYVPDGNFYSAIVKTPTVLPYIRERQGESVCWDSQGYGYYTLSEGFNSTLFYYQRSGYPDPEDM